MSSVMPAGRRRSAQAAILSAFPAVAKPFALLQPDRSGGDRLADLRSDRQRLRPRHGRLVQFLPTALLVFVAGHAADRYERKRVVQLCQLAEALTALFLAWGAYSGWLTVTHIFIATFVLGIGGAFESPTIAALLPLITPQGSLQRATAISSGAAQLATITGPALGGLAYALAPELPYGSWPLFWLLGAIADRRHRTDAAGRDQGCRDAGRSVRRGQVRPQQSRDPRDDLARSVCGAARRCDRAAADLCARYPGDRPARVSVSCARRPRWAPC